MGSQFEIMVDNHHGSNGNGQHHGSGGTTDDGGNASPTQEMMDLPSDVSVECPLCMENLDIDDVDFFPCSCEYQVCRFCWHRLKNDENGLCPACRQPYPDSPIHFSTISVERIKELKKQKRKQKQEKTKSKEAYKMSTLATLRVVQKNLLFVVGMSNRLANDEWRKEFAKFGKIIKMVINGTSAYVTYTRAEDAVAAIKVLNEANNAIKLAGSSASLTMRTTGGVLLNSALSSLRASLGTTKYCTHWLKGQACPKQPECMYLHEMADPEASFTKEEMQVGKHTEYEKRLISHYMEILAKDAREKQATSSTTTSLAKHGGTDSGGGHCRTSSNGSNSNGTSDNGQQQTSVDNGESLKKGSIACRWADSPPAGDQDVDQQQPPQQSHQRLHNIQAFSNVLSSSSVAAPNINSGTSSGSCCSLPDSEQSNGSSGTSGLGSLSGSTSSSASSTPDNVQASASTAAIADARDGSKQTVDKAENVVSSGTGNGANQSTGSLFDFSNILNGQHQTDVASEVATSCLDDDGLDFDPIKLALNDMHHSSGTTLGQRSQQQQSMFYQNFLGVPQQQQQQQQQHIPAREQRTGSLFSPHQAQHSFSNGGGSSSLLNDLFMAEKMHQQHQNQQQQAAQQRQLQMQQRFSQMFIECSIGSNGLTPTGHQPTLQLMLQEQQRLANVHYQLQQQNKLEYMAAMQTTKHEPMMSLLNNIRQRESLANAVQKHQQMIAMQMQSAALGSGTSSSIVNNSSSIISNNANNKLQWQAKQNSLRQMLPNVNIKFNEQHMNNGGLGAVGGMVVGHRGSSLEASLESILNGAGASNGALGVGGGGHRSSSNNLGLFGNGASSPTFSERSHNQLGTSNWLNSASMMGNGNNGNNPMSTPSSSSQQQQQLQYQFLQRLQQQQQQQQQQQAQHRNSMFAGNGMMNFNGGAQQQQQQQPSSLRQPPPGF